MKRRVLNLISISVSGQQNLICQTKHLFKMLMAIVALLISVTVSVAQQAKELNKTLSSMSNNEEVVQLESLMQDLQSTVYVSNDEIKEIGDTPPVCADVEASAINRLKETNPLFGSVLLITIRVESAADLSSTVALSELSGFTNLKYVQILCTVNCTDAQANRIVTGSKKGVSVFYLISKPS